MKKISVAVLLGVALFSTTITTGAQAISVVNGTSCGTAGASTTVKVHGISKAYICTHNPTGAAGALTWTLKNCVTYWNQALSQESNIYQQQSLVNVMTEPDKTTYTRQLSASMTKLKGVEALIKTKWCKAGL